MVRFFEMEARRLPLYSGDLSTLGRGFVRCSALCPLTNSTGSESVQVASRSIRTEVRRRASKEVQLDNIPGKPFVCLSIPDH